MAVGAPIGRRRYRAVRVYLTAGSDGIGAGSAGSAADLTANLTWALDSDCVAPRLEQLLDVSAALTAVRMIDHKDGNRVLVAYDLAANGDRSSQSQTLMAKLYASPAQAQRVYRTMSDLSSQVFAPVAGLGVPQPLGWLPERAMVIYRHVEGMRLDRLDPPEAVLEGSRSAGAWLAVLHRSRVSFDRHLSVTSEIANARLWAEMVDRAFPSGTAGAGRLCEALAQSPLATRTTEPGDIEVPIHKDFHLGHVIVGSEVTVVDLDEARLGDANFDVAHFCANLTLLALRSGTDDGLVATAQEAFLHAYAAGTGWRRDERFSFFYALVCMKMAKQIVTGRGPGQVSGEPEELARQTGAIIRAGEAQLHGCP